MVDALVALALIMAPGLVGQASPDDDSPAQSADFSTTSMPPETPDAKVTNDAIVKSSTEQENRISEERDLYKKSKYGGLEASDMKRMKELETENRKLKQMYAESQLQNQVLKDMIEKKR